MTKSDSFETTATTEMPKRLLDGIHSPGDIKALRDTFAYGPYLALGAVIVLYAFH